MSQVLNGTDAPVSAALQIGCESIGSFVSSSTSSVSTATAIVRIAAVALTAGSPTDVALTVAVLTCSFGEPAGTVILTHALVVSPGATVAVVLIGVVHVASSTVAGYWLATDSV